jgi:hypothetical protein
MKKTTTTLALLVLLLQVYSAQGQAVKYVLFEHFTQASCGPCATQNPAFQDGILTNNVGTVHHIAHHTSWPGVDPMNAYNPTDVADRVTYYSVSGVPTMQMLGKKWTGTPGGVTQAMVNSESAAGSPIKIDVSETSDGTDRSVRVAVHSMGTPPTGTFVLRTAIVESDISYSSPPGNNGETDFPNVLRKMVPSAAGDAITLASVGDSVIFNYTYTLDQSTWDTSKIYVISFVQEETTGEVINSGSTNDPKWGMLSSGSSFSQGSTGTASTFAVSLFNMDNTSGNFRIHFTKDQPTGWSASYTFQSSTNTADSIDVTIAANSSDDLSFNITPGSISGIGDYEAVLTSLDDPTIAPKVYNFHLMAGVNDLIVNNAAGLGDGSGGDASNWESSYEDGLIYAGSTNYAVTDHLVLTEAFKENALANVVNIYLNIGWTFPPFSDETIQNLSTFLDQGGRLLIAGQDIGWFVWEGSGTAAQQAFFTNYMGANYVSDLAPTPNDTATFNTNDAVFATTGNSDIINYYGGTYYYPEQITPATGADAIYFYNGDTNNIGGVKHESGAFKVVYLGIGLEMLGDVNVKNQIMKTAYDWFWDGVVLPGVPELATSTPTVKVYPNPFTYTTNVMINLKEQADVNMSLRDITGQLVYSNSLGFMNKGIHVEEVNASTLAGGVYFLQLSTPNSTVNQKLIINK